MHGGAPWSSSWLSRPPLVWIHVPQVSPTTTLLPAVLRVRPDCASAPPSPGALSRRVAAPGGPSDQLDERVRARSTAARAPTSSGNVVNSPPPQRVGDIDIRVKTRRYGATTIAITSQSRVVKGDIPGAGHEFIVRTRYLAARSRRLRRSASVSGARSKRDPASILAAPRKSPVRRRPVSERYPARCCRRRRAAARGWLVTTEARSLQAQRTIRCTSRLPPAAPLGLQRSRSCVPASAMTGRTRSDA